MRRAHLLFLVGMLLLLYIFSTEGRGSSGGSRSSSGYSSSRSGFSSGYSSSRSGSSSVFSSRSGSSSVLSPRSGSSSVLSPWSGSSSVLSPWSGSRSIHSYRSGSSSVHSSRSGIGSSSSPYFNAGFNSGLGSIPGSGSSGPNLRSGQTIIPRQRATLRPSSKTGAQTTQSPCCEDTGGKCQSISIPCFATSKSTLYGKWLSVLP